MIFFTHIFPVFLNPLLQRCFLYHWITLEFLVETNWPRKYWPISELSLLFHWSVPELYVNLRLPRWLFFICSTKYKNCFFSKAVSLLLSPLHFHINFVSSLSKVYNVICWNFVLDRVECIAQFGENSQFNKIECSISWVVMFSLISLL